VLRSFDSRPFVAKLSWGLGIACAANAAFAQSYPTKLIRIVAPATAGGPSDIISRTIGQKLSEAVGQPVILDNRPGAGGAVGSEFVARAPADGYTLLLGNNATHGINPGLYPKLPYDAVKDFAPITLTALGTNLLAVHPSLPARSVQALIALAKAKPGQLNFSSAGNGNTSHLAGEMLKTAAGINIVHVPFNGAAPAIVALIGGQVELTIVNMQPLVPHVRSGRLRALGIASSKRSSVLPEVPTMIEAGLKDFEVSTWFGLFAPAGTPRDIVVKLSEETTRIIRLPEVSDRFTSQGFEPVGGTPEQFATFVRTELARWAKAVKASGARVD